MTQFRWATSVVFGPWRDSQGAAVCDALVSGQAGVDPGPEGGIVLKTSASIQQRARPRDQVHFI